MSYLKKVTIVFVLFYVLLVILGVINNSVYSWLQYKLVYDTHDYQAFADVVLNSSTIHIILNPFSLVFIMLPFYFRGITKNFDIGLVISSLLYILISFVLLVMVLLKLIDSQQFAEHWYFEFFSVRYLLFIPVLVYVLIKYRSYENMKYLNIATLAIMISASILLISGVIQILFVQDLLFSDLQSHASVTKLNIAQNSMAVLSSLFVLASTVMFVIIGLSDKEEIVNTETPDLGALTE